MRPTPKLALVLLTALLLTPLLTAPSRADDPWRVGTWKTAQTIQPFVYQQFLPKQPVEVFPFTNPADQKMALLAGSLDLCGTTIAHAIHSASRGEPVVVWWPPCATSARPWWSGRTGPSKASRTWPAS